MKKALYHILHRNYPYLPGTVSPLNLMSTLWGSAWWGVKAALNLWPPRLLTLDVTLPPSTRISRSPEPAPLPSTNKKLPQYSDHSLIKTIGTYSQIPQVVPVRHPVRVGPWLRLRLPNCFSWSPCISVNFGRSLVRCTCRRCSCTFPNSFACNRNGLCIFARLEDIWKKMSLK